MPRKKKPSNDLQQLGQDLITAGQDLAALGIGLALLTPDQADSFVPLTTRDQWKRVPGKGPRRYYYTPNPTIVISYGKYKKFHNNPKIKKYHTYNLREFKTFPPAAKFFDTINSQDVIFVKAYGIPFKSSPPLASGQKPKKDWRSIIAPAYKFMHTGSEIEPLTLAIFSKVDTIHILWKARL